MSGITKDIPGKMVSFMQKSFFFLLLISWAWYELFLCAVFAGFMIRSVPFFTGRRSVNHSKSEMRLLIAL